MTITANAMKSSFRNVRVFFAITIAEPRIAPSRPMGHERQNKTIRRAMNKTKGGPPLRTPRLVSVPSTAFSFS
jgi:hypothetical protein